MVRKGVGVEPKKVLALGVGVGVVGVATASCAIVRASSSHTDSTIPMTTTFGEGTSDADREDLEALFAATEDVLLSDEFARNFLSVADSVGPLWLAPGGDTIDGTTTLGLILRAQHAVPVPVALTVTIEGAGDGRVTAETQVVHKEGESTAVATMLLGRKTVQRFQSHEVRACAINTVAHELTHTIPGVDGGPYIKDCGRTFASVLQRPLVSYVAGAVAECTYLERAKEISSADLMSCVESVGVNISVCRGAE